MTVTMTTSVLIMGARVDSPAEKSSEHFAQTAVHFEAATPVPVSPPSIEGTYELTERVMANGTVLRPPSIVALYTVADGQFSLNLFVKNRDGTVASESTVGRYTFSADK